MGVPAQVRKQIEEADQIAKAMYPEEQQEPEAEAEQQPGDEQAEAQTTSEQEQVAPEGGFGEAPEVVEQVSDAEQASEPEEKNEYEHKYKTLQGMYNSEKRRNDELNGRVQSLENMLAQMQQLRQAAAEEAGEQVREKPASLLSDEEIEDYGSDLIDVMKRAAREAVKDEIEGLKAENAKLKAMAGDIGQKLEEDERSKVYKALDAKVENWEEINRSEAFLDWLEEEDVYAGAPRKNLLNRAFMANDATRVVKFFKGFLNETAAVSPPPAGQPEPAPTKKKVPLESLAAPGVGASGSADNTSNQGRMWKESEIGAFYEAARKGAFKGREADYQRTERSIQAAMNEGRILVGQ